MSQEVKNDSILEVKNLSISFPLRFGTIHAVNKVDFALERNKITALVGESGSGKTTLANALLRVVSSPGVIDHGKILFEGKDILGFGKEELRLYKWKDVAMVFQAAQNALNPLMTIENQMIETYRVHMGPKTQDAAIKRGRELLDYVRLDAKRVMGCYPHELSGGMKQRVMIAFALLLSPKVLILDEPTTALDVITQDYVFDILTQIYQELHITMLLLTHDIAVVARFAHEMNVMYAGHIVEKAPMMEMFASPAHAYTRQLLHAAPSLVDELREREAIAGAPPDLLHPPAGCAFAPRCPNASDKCLRDLPLLREISPDHFIQCSNLYQGGVEI